MNRFAPRLVTAPASTPVSLAEVKDHLRIGWTDEDALLGGLVGAATAHLDGWSGTLGRAIITQTWSQSFDAFADRIPLYVGPVASVTSVIYTDPAGSDVTLAGSAYRLLRDAGGDYVERVPGTEWPAIGDRADAVRVTYVAGEASAPVAIKQAMLLLIGHWYRERDGAGAAEGWPPAVNALLAPYRMTVAA